jgi:hypothetical protein
VACAAETVQKAVRNAPDERLFILPVTLKGRGCYRVGWGVYADEARARTGLGTVPSYFRQGGAKPRVVTMATLLN